ncbi:MAG: hydrogenase expression/formation protein HypE [Steroidobacteraceae bacterium]
MEDTHVSLAHGNGGRFMRELIAEVFVRHLANPTLDTDADAVALSVAAALAAQPGAEVMFTTDSFTVQPLEFPGGDIGSLAVHGTTNDLAVSGATPAYLSLNAIIEEGLEIATLDRIIASLAAAARDAGVVVVAGDTKVVRHGEAAGLYLASAGIGVRAAGCRLGLQRIRAGDRIIVSGPVGDHGTAVLLAREQFGLRGDLESDSACVLPLTQSLIASAGDALHFMRDPTRGGFATVCHEIARATGCGIRLLEEQIPVREPVRSVCDMLGYDPLFLACEGRVVAVVAPEKADAALAGMRALAQGRDAQEVGEISDPPAGRVVMRTVVGGERVLQELEDDPLPRIC